MEKEFHKLSESEMRSEQLLKDFHELRLENDNILQKNKQLEWELEESRTDSQEMGNSISSLKSENTKLRSSLQNSEEKLRKEQGCFKENEHQIEEMQKTLDRLKSEYSVLNKKYTVSCGFLHNHIFLQ